MHKFIEWESLDLRKMSGTEKLRCPECDATRSDKRDKSLVVYHNDGFARCFYCDALSFRDSNRNEQPTFTLPTQDWKNHTTLSDKLVKWVKSARNISQSTLIELGITEEIYFQPAVGSDRNNIVFNYFEGDVVVNKKYRTPEKHFTQSKGGKAIFYNLNAAIGEKVVFIVEGEFDVLAMHERGFKSTISVPNGANDNDAPWIHAEPYLKNVERFVICTDNDKKGIELRDKISQRLGRWRCEFVEFKHKDANGDLINGCLTDTMKNRKRFPITGTFVPSDFTDEILDLYRNGLPKTIAPKHECFGDLSKIFSTMRGHVVTSTGIPNHGKSAFVDWYVLNLVYDYELKASWFTPEHGRPEMHQTSMAQKAVGKSFYDRRGLQSRMTEKDVERYLKWSNEKIYITETEHGEFPTWDWIFDKFKEQMFNFGIDVFVIDAFNKLGLSKGMSKLDAIGEVMAKLTMFAQMNNVTIFLVAHPTKMSLDEQTKLYRMPTMYDVSGSADFYNQTHDGFTIHRIFETEETAPRTIFSCEKLKNQFQGKVKSKVAFQYDPNTSRLYAEGEAVPSHDLTQPKQPEPEPEFEPLVDFSEPMHPNTDFDFKESESDELPF